MNLALNNNANGLAEMAKLSNNKITKFSQGQELNTNNFRVLQGTQSKEIFWVIAWLC